MPEFPIWPFLVIHAGAAYFSYNLIKTSDSHGWRIFWTFFLVANVFYFFVTLYQVINGNG